MPDHIFANRRIYRRGVSVGQVSGTNRDDGIQAPSRFSRIVAVLRAIFLLGWLVMLLPKETISSLGPAFHFPSGRASLGGGVLGVKMAESKKNTELREVLSRMTDSEVVRYLFSYDPESGNIVRVRGFTGGRPRSNSPEGTACIIPPPGATLKYATVRFGRRRMLAHRLVWLYMTGEHAPKRMDIDHINGDLLDNRWSNLRIGTRAQNMQNQARARGNSTTGLLGVSVACGSPGRWFARINVGGKVRFLGCHTSPEAAHAAYIAAKRELHEFSARV